LASVPNVMKKHQLASACWRWHLGIYIDQNFSNCFNLENEIIISIFL
jgi:hypothetical protein